MIFKIKFSISIVFAQAKGWSHLFEEFKNEYGYHEFTKIESISNISDNEAKTIMLKNTDKSTYKECPVISLYDLRCGDDFVIIGSKELE